MILWAEKTGKVNKKGHSLDIQLHLVEPLIAFPLLLFGLAAFRAEQILLGLLAIPLSVARLYSAALSTLIQLIQ